VRAQSADRRFSAWALWLKHRGAAAAFQPDEVAAVVSRSGRPDLAGKALPKVKASTLLIGGGADYGVIEVDEGAATALQYETRVVLVPHAMHLFEEPRTLEQVVTHAADWFMLHLGKGQEDRTKTE